MTTSPSPSPVPVTPQGDTIPSAASADVARERAARFGAVWLDSAVLEPDPALAGLFPADFLRRHRLLPLGLEGDHLRLVMADPGDLGLLDAAASHTGRTILPCSAPEDLILRSIGRLTPAPVEGDVPDVAAGERKTTATGDPADAQVVEVVHRLILAAVHRRASDIHLEPGPRQLRIRYRVDGELVEAEPPPRSLQRAIISRLKILANISIAERRRPQDGRMRFPLAGRALDLRVATLPTLHGESVVLRLLDPNALQPHLRDLGLDGAGEGELAQLARLPDGLILVTGPTGSGKTTTLYALLAQLNQPDCKIITVEDPVEYQLPGINQVQVQAETGLTFASALRAILRQSPNVVMIGEIRDAETASIAIQAALTGHLVLSTMHTNDAVGAVTRLLDLGIKPYLVSAALRGVLAQRLVRRICGSCHRPENATARAFRAAGLPDDSTGGSFSRGAGCAACAGTGFRGRLGIFELLSAGEGFAALILERATAARLRDCARRNGGFRTLREDGVRKVLAGLTTIEEVVSVTSGEYA